MVKTTRMLLVFAALLMGATVVVVNRDRLLRDDGSNLIAAGKDEVARVAAFQDPLDLPADAQENPVDKPMMSIAWTGKDLVGVGMRGLIVTATSPQGPWQQSKVPVQSDLLSVQFIDSARGWAVGHDGVVLHTEDGGKNWFKQLDGREVIKLFDSFYKKRDGTTEPSDWATIRKQLAADFKTGPSLPFRDVLFVNANVGYVIGSFGLIAGTHDGGKNWEPLLHKIDNPEGLHLNAIRAIAGNVYIAGERGRIYRLDRESGDFVAASTGYAGSFFGIVGNDRVLVVFGLRGTVYRSVDGGTTWALVKVPVRSTLVGGAYLSGTRRFVLASDDGQLIISDPGGTQFESATPRHPMGYTDLHAIGDGDLALTGYAGIRFEKLSSVDSPK